MSTRLPNLPSGASLRDDARGVSELLGVVLLVGIVVLAATTLAVYGNAAVASNEDRVDVERATTGLQQLDTRASRVALGESDVQRLDVGVAGTGGSLDTRPDDGWMRVTVVNSSTGVDDAVVVNETLGAVVYTHGDTTVAYQGGGVWRSDGDGSTMISRPEFHVRNDTLTLPIIVTDGSGGVYSDVQVRSAGPAVKKFPDPSRNLTNKVQTVKLQVTVQSDYYLAWGRYFEEHTGGYVVYDHGAETVTVTYLSLSRWVGLDSGIIATAASGKLNIEGNGAYTDSYDSRDGPYDSSTATANGTIVAVGDVDMAGGSTVNGDVRSGALVDLDGSSEVTGIVYHTEPFDTSKGTFGGNKTIDGVATVEPIDGYVYQNVALIRGNNNNSDTSLIDANNRLDLSSGGATPTLGPGTYYLEDLTLDGETLTLDPAGGNITIAVRDYVQVKNSGTLEVAGTGNVRIFVAGENSLSVSVQGGGRSDLDNINLHVDKGSAVTEPYDNSTRLVVYGTQEFGTAIDGPSGTKFVGVVYAPAGYDGTGAAHIMASEVYGAVVTGSLTVGSKGAIHYDEALTIGQFPRSPTVTRIEYMHVSVHPIEVTAD